MKSIRKMTRTEFEAVPAAKWDEDIGEFDSLVVIPAEIDRGEVSRYNTRSRLHKILPTIFREPEIYEITGLHDSGYRCMGFVACRGDMPLRYLSGCSDVVNLDGIGGYGKDWLQIHGTVPQSTHIVGWNIDCLTSSGLLRIFPSPRFVLIVGHALSNFEIFAVPRTERTIEITKGGIQAEEANGDS
jgi:hypothetical protein